MPSLPGVNHLRAIAAFEKAGFTLARQGKHVVMTNGERIIVIPRANPIFPSWIPVFICWHTRLL
jgi:predicted RNA binding protein YcfA (HicA-like mRNA interferase family)